jgi:hypothetical protein
MERFEFAARGDFRLAAPAAVFARYLTPPWKTVFALPDSLLTLRVRLAWAHDFDPGRSIAATFQALPGTNFVVNGAAQGPRLRAVTRFRGNQMAERLVHLRGRVLRRHANVSAVYLKRQCAERYRSCRHASTQ